MTAEREREREKNAQMYGDLAIRASYLSRLSRLSVFGKDFTGRARKSGCSQQRETAFTDANRRRNGPIYIRCRRRGVRVSSGSKLAFHSYCSVCSGAWTDEIWKIPKSIYMYIILKN